MVGVRGSDGHRILFGEEITGVKESGDLGIPSQKSWGAVMIKYTPSMFLYGTSTYYHYCVVEIGSKYHSPGYPEM